MTPMYAVFDRDRRSFVSDQAGRRFFETPASARHLFDAHVDPDGFGPELSIVEIEEVFSG